MTGDRALERYRALVEGLAEAVSVWDEDGGLVLANPAFWRMAGREPEDGPLTLRWSGWRVLDPSGAPLPFERWPATMALREGRAIDEQTIGLVRPGGDRAWLRARAVPIDVGGGRLEAIVSLRDVTVERQALAEVRASHDILRALIDGIPYAVVLKDRAGRYLAVNEAFCEWSGVSREQVEGRTPADTLPPGWSEAAEESRRRMETLGEAFTEEVADATGARVWQVVRTPYHDRSGTLAGMVVMAIEVTEHRALEAELMAVNAGLERRVRARTAELERAAAELEAFAYRVSHDLRAPLRSLQVTAARLSGGLTDAAVPGASDDLRRMEEGIDAMAGLIGALLDLSHAGRRAVALERIGVDLGAVAGEAVAEVEAPARERGVAIEVAELPVWRCDPRLLRQALVNLLSNAVKFSRPGGGRVRVTCARHDDALVVTVADDGVGFDPGESERLFTPFGRLANAADVEGTGIGLAIVHRIVTAHGGRIWAAPDPASGGATFSFSLPGADD